MPDIYDELLQKTFLSYQQGCAKNHHISSQISGDIFSEILQTLISRNLPLCDQLLLRRYDNAREQGLLAARRGQLAVAQQFCHPRAHSWFLVKLAIAQNNIDSFLQRAANFLAEGVADTPLLWYSIIFDWLDLCSRFGRVNLSQEIAADAVISNYFPRQMIPLFNKHLHKTMS